MLAKRLPIPFHFKLQCTSNIYRYRYNVISIQMKIRYSFANNNAQKDELEVAL